MKKHKLIELDVDFIGGERPLTKEDEIAISNYIRTYKAKHSSREALSKRAARITRKKRKSVDQ